MTRAFLLPDGDAMNLALLTLPIEIENDVVVARQRARQIGGEVGLGAQDQVRLATAVSEIARNAFDYAGGGIARFAIDEIGQSQRLVVDIVDEGPGIAELATILAGKYRSRTGLGIGITGSMKLVENLHIDTVIGKGTAVRLEKAFPAGRRISSNDLPPIIEAIRRLAPTDVFSELRNQNRELAEAGVLLSRQSQELRELNETLEARVEAAIKARRAAENRVRQSQKMEAMGQLTGGIAHDFNNMIAAVGGGVRLLEKKLSGERPDLDIYLVAIQDALERAKALSDRLMAFARQQPRQVETVDANDLVRGMQDLITRTFGAGIAISFELSSKSLPVQVDRSEFENCLLNLCVNARDAMPSGGQLMVTVKEAHRDDLPENAPHHSVADWVQVEVKDTSTGMSEETLAMVLEPFFTTKDAGKGTGLGLAQVYSFADTAGGCLELQSSVGVGTTISVFLPVF